MNMQTTESPGWAQTGAQPTIAIIGAGLSGIATVVKLRKAGYTDITVYEKADRVGGTWRENTYPGLSCDVPSAWYSFTFALKANWSHRFSYGPEIQAYLERVAKDFKVNNVVQFNTPVTSLIWEGAHWRLTTGEGDQYNYDVVIAATGILHHPAYPNIEGLDSFEGASFHSSRWDHSVDYGNKRVGVIGTGSTAAQIVGKITDQVNEMFVFQRTPQWMTPLPQKKYSFAWKALLTLLPFLKKKSYDYYSKFLSQFAEASVGNKEIQNKVSAICRKNLERNVPDLELRKKLTPDYQAACKRLIFCSDFYPAISRDNAHLITEDIVRITPKGVETADGNVHELDVLVLATGFNPSAFILPTEVTGENGRSLKEFWGSAPRAHRSVALPGFPNFWMIEGPTGPVGNLSLVTISEAQVDYVISMLDKMKAEGLASVTAKENAYETYNSAMVEAIDNTVWVTGGCDSWYIDESGKPNLYPWHPDRFLEQMANPDFDEYHLHANSPTPIEGRAL